MSAIVTSRHPTVDPRPVRRRAPATALLLAAFLIGASWPSAPLQADSIEPGVVMAVRSEVTGTPMPTSTVDTVVLPENHPPVARARSITVATDPGKATATVIDLQIDDGSSDPDGDRLAFLLEPFGPFPLGATAVQLIVADGTVASVAPAIITVVDCEPPRIVNGARQPVLFANDHQLVDIGFLMDARDNVRVIDISISVTQNEPVHAGPGDPSPDGVVRTDSAGHILGLSLRSERSDAGHGRIYLISTTAFDTSGNRKTASSAVVVPKSTSIFDLFDVIGQALSAVLAGTPLPYDSRAPTSPG
jgi:hypothetical protein